MPRSLMELASSSSWAAGKSRRGLRGLGRRNSIGTLRWPRTRSEVVLVSAPMSPISDAKPRPSRDRVDSSAMAASPEKSFKRFASSPHNSGACEIESVRRSGQFPLALDELGCEPQIGLATYAFEVIHQHRLTV